MTVRERFLDRRTRGYAGWLLFLGAVGLAVSHIWTGAPYTTQEVVTNVALLVGGLLMRGAIDGDDIRDTVRAWRSPKE